MTPMRRSRFSTLKPKPPSTQQDPLSLKEADSRIVVAKGPEDTSRERDHDIPCTD